ncbi:hypothetical protein [Romboutsia lituseburensis]|nr:hypothetical protein [Romboutsia lituseburensis]MCR8744370.1 hypothetical protein [Romboutsia lituseburensis]
MENQKKPAQEGRVQEQVKTINQMRKEHGLKPIKGGDIVLIPIK